MIKFLRQNMRLFDEHLRFVRDQQVPLLEASIRLKRQMLMYV